MKSLVYLPFTGYPQKPKWPRLFRLCAPFRAQMERVRYALLAFLIGQNSVLANVRISDHPEDPGYVNVKGNGTLLFIGSTELRLPPGNAAGAAIRTEAQQKEKP